MCHTEKGMRLKMSVFLVFVGVALILVLMVVLKIDGFISLMLSAIAVGLMEGMQLTAITKSIYNGIGDQLKSLILILAFGAMLGKLLAESGAAPKIADTLIKKFGLKNVQWAVLLTAIIIGITMFFEAGFVVLIPIIYTVAAETKLPLLYIGLPGIVGLAATHAFLPPHPGPAAVAVVFNANMGKTMLLGLPIAIIAATLLGVFYARTNWIKKIKSVMPEGLISTKQLKEEELPGFGISILSALLPVFLIAISTVGELLLVKNDPLQIYLGFFGSAPIALFIAVLFAMYFLGIARGMTMDEITKINASAVKAIAMIVLVIAAGGAFKQVIVDSGVANSIKTMTMGLQMNPYMLAWFVGAIIRIAVGSSTVAVTMASGIVLPLLSTVGINPELMVLATACGTVFCSHVNDPGFWMFKEYFGLSLIDTMKVRTVYSSLLSITGLIGVLIISAIL
ncbi:MAG: high-affinity transport of gluconate - gluconate permease [Firmicutes bacterium]|nr:high-affinity transport of gluconate - gluconate permease [Bacillota bacterium]